jgi:hypothetical protein
MNVGAVLCPFPERRGLFFGEPVPSLYGSAQEKTTFFLGRRLEPTPDPAHHPHDDVDKQPDEVWGEWVWPIQ